MDVKTRYQSFLNHLRSAPALRKTELIYHTPFQLLIAVILSAQCTDKRINLCTPALFQAFPTPEKLSQASFSAVIACIKSITYPKSKTTYLLETARLLVNEFQGVVPDSIAALQTLPGVGRKTAHVVASILYDQPVIGVDTHLFRVAKRIGLASSASKTPFKVEQELMRYLPIEQVQAANQWMLLHGRYICVARNPRCHQCTITNFCNYFQSNQHEIQTNSIET